MARKIDSMDDGVFCPDWEREDSERPHRPSRRRAGRSVPTSNGEAPSALPIGERKILTACIQHPTGLKREQLTVLTGYKRSSRDTYLQRLRERGLIGFDGELVQATSAGVATLPDCQPLPTGPELHDHYRNRLPSGELKILEVLIAAYPEAVDREALSEQTGYQRSSRDTYLQRLRARQLVVEHGRGQVRASEHLF